MTEAEGSESSVRPESGPAEGTAPVSVETAPASVETAPASVETAPKGEPPKGAPSGLGRVVEWFWQSAALAELKAKGLIDTQRSSELRRRASLAAELGGRALEPSEPLQHGPADALACELYRESIFWSLAAHAEMKRKALQDAGAPETEAETAALGVTEPDSAAQADRAQADDGQLGAAQAEKPKVVEQELELAVLWVNADAELLRRSAGGRDAVNNLGKQITAKTFKDFAELEPTAQARLGRSLRIFSEALVTQVDPTGPALERLWARRVTRVALLVVAIGVMVFGLPRFFEWRAWRVDYAEGSPWRISSRYPEGGCESPDQACPGEYFFATHEEENAWIEFDLQTPQHVSRILIENRRDCCGDRASPLVIEVSPDQKQWTRVARRDGGDFDSWTARFPSVQARWVKISVEKRTNLHFRRVRIAK